MSDKFTDLKDKVVFITGASRGIGRAIALKMAQHGAHIVIAAKTSDPHPKLEGTIHTVAQEIMDLGAQVLPIQMDIRDDEQIDRSVQKAIDHFGKIDILVNNASAIDLSSTENISVKKLDLMLDINVRGTYLMSRACLPYLKMSHNPHILNLSPPPKLKPEWLSAHSAYTLSKYAMSMCVIAMAEEYEKIGISINGIWPMTIIGTAAINMIGGELLLNKSRKPEIVADAAYVILSQPRYSVTGKFFIDEEILKEQGVKDFEAYAIKPGTHLKKDLFIE